MAYGITPAGFTPMRLQDIKLALETELKTVFGDVNLEPTSVFGQFVGVLSKVFADWWAGLEDVYLSQYPATAAGVSLDNVVMLVGITRLPAVKTRVTCQTTGTGGTTIPAGSQVANTNGNIFNSEADIIIPGEGVFIANVSGLIPAIAGTVTNIVTPISGWDTVDNVDNGTLGREQETDSELRVRRELSLAIIGAGTVEAIRSRISNDVLDVVDCSVFENTSDIVDADGRPPHSIEVVVSGGENQDIGDMLWQIKPGGIQLYQNPISGQTVTVLDSNGDNQVVYFTRPIVKYCHLEITIVAFSTEENFPLDGVSQIETKVLEYAANFAMGEDINIQKWNIPIYAVPGLSDVTIRHAVTDNPGDTPTWVTTNISISAVNVTELALTRITVIA
jgi:uncharacterized phage protein gp47/JayE